MPRGKALEFSISLNTSQKRQDCFIGCPTRRTINLNFFLKNDSNKE